MDFLKWMEIIWIEAEQVWKVAIQDQVEDQKLVKNQNDHAVRWEEEETALRHTVTFLLQNQFILMYIQSARLKVRQASEKCEILTHQKLGIVSLLLQRVHHQWFFIRVSVITSSFLIHCCHFFNLKL